MATATTSPRIDGGRLLERLATLGEVGSTGDGGCARLALTDDDRAGRDLVVTWMRDLGLDVRIDQVGNIIATFAGTEPELAPVMCGSHIDTVRTGGRYDGNYGVLAGLEVIESWLAVGLRPRRSLAVGVFTGEEGARFAPDMLGSLVYVGGLGIDEAHDALDAAGVRLADELDSIGYHGDTPCPGPTPHAFVELHIEQGPVLEADGVTIGAVTGVQGISWQELTITGQSNHAGTTPMALRHDPSVVVAELTMFVRRLTQQLGGHQVGTVGRVELFPNLINVIPARAVMTVDLRNTDPDRLRVAESAFADECRMLEQSEGVTIERRSLARFDPVEFDATMVDAVERVAGDLDLSVERLPSGAGHDAQMLARVCPAGMIFVPSVGEISHNPAEHTSPADLEAGANVLAVLLAELAELGAAG